MKKFIYMLLAFILLITLIGCNNSIDESDIPINEHDLEQINEIIPVYYAPLTGLPVDKEIDTRIIGVMINNLYLARPQSGLDKADIVYEVLAEGMITRFVALYQSQQPDVIGPVRSTRPYYIDLINGFDGIIVHCGASFEAYDILRNYSLPYLDEITNSGGTFWRATFRNPPHNVYTSYEKIISGVKSKGYREDGYIPSLVFLDDNQVVEGELVGSLKIDYHFDYHVEYVYNNETKLFDRYINDKSHIDLETGEQLTAKNILVIKTSHTVLDKAGRLAVDVYGPGEGYLFQNGVVRLITWERKDGVIRAYIDGKEQGLYPGQTWVMVVQDNTPVSYQ